MDLFQILLPYIGLKANFVKLLNTAYQKAVFGKPYCDQINLMNDLVYLIIYLELVKDEITAEYDICTEMDAIMEDFSLQCIIDNFNCKGINVKPLILTLLKEDGIGNMAIYPSADDCDSLFIVS